MRMVRCLMLAFSMELYHRIKAGETIWSSCPGRLVKVQNVLRAV